MNQSEDLFGIIYDKNDVIFREGDMGDFMYIIQSGVVEISHIKDGNRNVLAILEKGNIFGEMALIDSSPRSATATSISRSRLLLFTRDTLMERIRQDPGVVIHLLNTLCERLSETNLFLRNMVLGDEQLRFALECRRRNSPPSGEAMSEEDTRILSSENSHTTDRLQIIAAAGDIQIKAVDVFVDRKECIWIEPDEAIFRQGEQGHSMYIIVEGEVEISQGEDIDKHVLATLGPGEFFGEMSLITSQPRTADAIAVKRSLLLPIKRDEFLARIQAEPELAVYILQGLIIRLRMMLIALSDPKKSPNIMLRNIVPPLKKRSLVRTAIISLSTCGGCSAVLLENPDELAKLLEKVNISYCPMLIDSEEIGEVDIAIVDGTVRVKEDEEKLIEARHKSKYLVAWGTCATFGGIPVFANEYDLEELIHESYGETKDTFSYYLSGTRGIDWSTYQQQESELKLMRRARKADDFVQINYYLPGCPPNVRLLSNLVDELRGDGQPEKTKAIVCAECSRKPFKTNTDYFRVYPRPEWDITHCFTSCGSICMGFITKGGCGAPCTRGGLPCWGCRGPSETAFKKIEEGSSYEEFMLHSLVSRHRQVEEQVKTVMKIYRKQCNSSLKFSRYFPNDRSRIR
jgi:F420-non-reducing hydrogenase small subunit